MNKFQKFLNDIKPYVIIVGSYGRFEETDTSDLDIYVKRRPQEILDNDWYGELEENYIDVITNAIEYYGWEYDSLGTGHIIVNRNDDIPINLEFYDLFNTHKDTPIKTRCIFGIEMSIASDNKNISIEEHLEYQC